MILNASRYPLNRQVMVAGHDARIPFQRYQWNKIGYAFNTDKASISFQNSASESEMITAGVIFCTVTYRNEAQWLFDQKGFHSVDNQLCGSTSQNVQTVD